MDNKIIEDENGLNLVAVTIDKIQSCDGCHYEKKAKCPLKLVEICTTGMCSSENSIIFRIADKS